MTDGRRSWLNPMLRLALMLACLAVNPVAAKAQSCTQNISPGTSVASTISASAAGSTICLDSGSYGSATLSGVKKNPRVTIRSTSGQGARLSVTFQSGTEGITVDSVTMTGARFLGSTTRNITVQNSAFTDSVTFDGLANANVLFDNNTHNGINSGQGDSPARLHLAYGGSTHSGVTIQNSLMDGGSADGVQTGVGVNIINNVMRNIREGSCGDCHTDAIQLLDAADSVIRGNYIHNCSTGIVAYDGLIRATIEYNVIDLGAGGRAYAIELASDLNSIVRHNTLLFRSGCFGSPSCGIISLDHKPVDPAGRGTIVVDNIASSISTANGSTYAERHHNLVRSGAVSGDIAGSPTYVGGALPTTWAGYQLANGSLGKGAASSPAGSDIGTAVQGTPPPPPGGPTNLRIVP